MLCRDRPRSATLRLGRVRGIVRGQTFFPSETGRQTILDVIRIWSVRIRQGETDLPGRSAVRRMPNCVPLSSGHPFHASELYSYYIQGVLAFLLHCSLVVVLVTERDGGGDEQPIADLGELQVGGRLSTFK